MDLSQYGIGPGELADALRLDAARQLREVAIGLEDRVGGDVDAYTDLGKVVEYLRAADRCEFAWQSLQEDEQEKSGEAEGGNGGDSPTDSTPSPQDATVADRSDGYGGSL